MNQTQSKLLAPALAVVALRFAAPLAAQTITPDPVENHVTIDDTGCLEADVMIEGGVRYETFMKSAVNLSPVGLTATLPLYQGYVGPGNKIPTYYIITEASDCATAKMLGVNYAPKLGFLIDKAGRPINKSVQAVTLDADDNIHFTGTADFSPIRTFVPSTALTPSSLDPVADGPQAFPPASYTPGSVGDGNYSPLITYTTPEGKHIVLNATQVANQTGVKDFIPEIDFTNGTVTFNVVHGIYNFHFVLYLRMDASDPLISAFEGGIYAPNLELVPTNGDRFFADNSARQVILPVINGPRGVDKVFGRQGVQSAALGEGDPFNVMGAKPGELEYSPLWDITPPTWTAAADAFGKRIRLQQDDEVRNFVNAGFLTSWGPAAGAPNADFTGPLATTGLKSLDIVSNCPILMRVLSGMPTFIGGR